MSKYETTSAQYCQFLNEALASGDITVNNGRVFGANGSNSGADFLGESYTSCDMDNCTSSRRIAWDGTSFTVCTDDGYDMCNHPVVNVTWYGAVAFCNYYGFRLPTEWEWQAVADYDGSFIYGCGKTIDYNKANYDWINPLGLSDYPYTTPVDYYFPYGYDMYDMAGNVWEWTSTVYGPGYNYRIFRGGGYNSTDYHCTVSASGYMDAAHTDNDRGFRVCR
jgi:formylglycine-generating enzyme required for sulfatase activity